MYAVPTLPYHLTHQQSINAHCRYQAFGGTCKIGTRTPPKRYPSTPVLLPPQHPRIVSSVSHWSVDAVDDKGDLVKGALAPLASCS